MMMMMGLNEKKKNSFWKIQQSKRNYYLTFWKHAFKLLACFQKECRSTHTFS